MLNGAKDLYAAARLRGLGAAGHLVLSINNPQENPSLWRPLKQGVQLVANHAVNDKGAARIGDLAE